MMELSLKRMQTYFSATALLLVVLLLAVACSNPVDRDSSSDSASSTPADDPQASPTQVPVMVIVTPTAGNPDQVPDSSTESDVPLEIPDTYVVEDGDTLYAISSKFGIELAALVEANGLTDPNGIFVGQELIIPKPGQ